MSMEEDIDLTDIDFINRLSQSNLDQNISLYEEELFANHLINEIKKSSIDLDRKKHQEAQLPPHLEAYRSFFEEGHIKEKSSGLPILSQLTPRSKKKLSLLPAPNEFEQEQIKSLEKLSRDLGPDSFYKSLKSSKQHQQKNKKLNKEKKKDSGINRPEWSHLNKIDNPSSIAPNEGFNLFQSVQLRKQKQSEEKEKMLGLFDDTTVSSSVGQLHKANSSKSPMQFSHIQLPRLETLGQPYRQLNSFLAEKKKQKDSQKQPIQSVPLMSRTTGFLGLDASSQSKEKDPKIESFSKVQPPSIARSTSNHNLKQRQELRSIDSQTKRLLDEINDPRRVYNEYKPILQEVRDFQQNKVANILKETSNYQMSLEKINPHREKEFLNEFSVKVYDEIGLDINMSYNRYRKYKEALHKILFHVYMLKMRAGFSHFRYQVSKTRESVEIGAISVVIRAIRRFIADKALREKELLLSRQREAQVQRERDRKIYEQDMSRIVFNAVFKHAQLKSFRRKWKIKRATIKLQSLIRGFMGRQRFQRMWALNLQLNQQATRIQCAYRIHLSRRKVVVMAKIKFVQGWLDHLKEERQHRMEKMKCNGAEIYIAKAFRTYIARKKLRKLIYWNRFGMAMTIQRYYRGFHARRLFAQDIQNFRRKVKHENAMALTIQRAYRRYRSRLLYLEKASIKEKESRRRFKLKVSQMNARKFSLWDKLKQKWLRYQPYYYLRLEKAATHFQRLWRGYWARRRCFILRINRVLLHLASEQRIKEKHVGKIQKRWRGYRVRKLLYLKKREEMALILQCAWRFYFAGKRVKKLKVLNEQAFKLSRKLRRLHKRWIFHKKWVRLQSFIKYVYQIQCFFRMLLAKRRCKRLKAALRQSKETRLFQEARLRLLLANVQIRIIQDTLHRPIGRKYHAVFSKEDCPCYGPLQAVFVLGACQRGKVDKEALITNKTELNSVGKFLRQISGLMVGEKEENIEEIETLNDLGEEVQIAPTKGEDDKKSNDKDSNRIQEKGDQREAIADNDAQMTSFPSKPATNRGPLKRSKSQLTRNSRQAQELGQLPSSSTMYLIHEIDLGNVFVPSAKVKLRNSKIDILFNKCKASDSATPFIGYAEFIALLSLIAESHYTHPSVATAGSLRKKAALDNEHLETIQTQAKETLEEVKDVSVSDLSFNLSSLDNLKHLVSNETKLNSHTLKSLDTESLFYGEKADFLLAFVLKILASFQHHEWMAGILQWMNKEALARVEHFVTRIQRIFKQKIAMNLFNLIKQKRLAEEKHMRESALATLMQNLIRCFLSRRKAARVAQHTIFKYIPHLGVPYWYNTKTKLKSFEKPIVLRNLDCYTVVLPEEGLELFAFCCYCNQPADLNCLECEDSMCRLCFDSMHFKGQRRRHTIEKIINCSYCKFQVATKNCLTCILNKPQKGTIQESMSESERGYFCDTCFIYEHDKFEQELLESEEKKRDLKNILTYSKEAYLVHQRIRQSLHTSHNFDYLVQYCEECQWRAATWRCFDCNQVYCNRCLVGLHSISKAFSRHKSELLPYYSPSMHKSYQRDINAAATQRKFEKLKRIAARNFQQLQYDSAVRIQSWWRMLMYGKRGRLIMRRKRRTIRIAHKARKTEDRRDRSSLSYKVLDLFGMAPVLSTDTRRERVLKSVHAYKRIQVLNYVRKNKEDWGHYRKSRTDPRKGIPKTEFEVGEIDELIDQARFGGYRLPGRILVRHGEKVFSTTHDLTEFLRSGEIIRIQKRLFGVVKVDAESVKVNRLWRSLDAQEEGEVAYRVPIYRNEPQRFKYRLKYLAYDLTIGNPLFQLTLKVYKTYCLSMMRFSFYMSRMNRRNKNMDDAAEWRKTGVDYADKAQWATNLMSTNEEIVDLTGIDRPGEDLEDFEDDNDDESLGGPFSLRKHNKKGAKKNYKMKKKNAAAEDMSLASSVDSSEDLNSIKEPMQKKKPLNGKSKGSKSSRVHADSVSIEEEPDDEASFEGDENEADGQEEAYDSFFSPEEQAVKQAKKADAPAPKLGKQKRGMSFSTKNLFASEDLDKEVKVADKKLKNDKKKTKLTGRAPGVQWYATREEQEARKAREDKMSPEDLASEANEWKECVDIMTENIYYLNLVTNEVMTTIPRSVATKRQLEFENSKNKKNYDEAQKRIRKLELVTKNRLLITGGRKK